MTNDKRFTKISRSVSNICRTIFLISLEQILLKFKTKNTSEFDLHCCLDLSYYKENIHYKNKKHQFLIKMHKKN